MIKNRIAIAKQFVLDNPVACGVAGAIVAVIAIETINSYRKTYNYDRAEVESMMFDLTDSETIALIDRVMDLKN